MVTLGPLHRLLKSNAAVILDGGLATELERRGADLDDPLWSAKVLLEQPELIRQVHLDFLQAGADVITSASYQATVEGFLARGLGKQDALGMIRRSVDLALRARDEHEGRAGKHALVAASVGTYGAALHDGSEYRGDFERTAAELADWHRPRLACLAASGCDLVACETIPCLREAEALAMLLPEFPAMHAWVSFSCRDDRHLRHGETLREAVQVLEACPQVEAVGVNCTQPCHVAGLLASVRGETCKLLLAYPNSGEGWDAARRNWVRAPEALDWTQAARAWYHAGARLLGGCCRTTPATIAAMAAAFARPATRCP